MTTNTPRSTSRRAPLTLLLGAVMAALIWLAGSPETSFVGFVLAAVLAETSR